MGCFLNSFGYLVQSDPVKGVGLTNYFDSHLDISIPTPPLTSFDPISRVKYVLKDFRVGSGAQNVLGTSWYFRVYSSTSIPTLEKPTSISISGVDNEFSKYMSQFITFEAKDLYYLHSKCPQKLIPTNSNIVTSEKISYCKN